jgi:hypothetical protein
MTVAARYARLGDWLWFLAWVIASSTACISTAHNTGATFDEPLHIACGVEGWRTGSHHGLIHLGAMPLPIDLYTLPLYLWERWTGSPFDLSRDVGQLLPWFRLGAIIFWCLLLFYGRLIGRCLAGPWGGRVAVAMLACEPSLLAHASLGGTDIAVTACLVALVYHFWAGRDAAWRGRLAWPAFWYGAAVLAKASGLVFGPLCMVVIELERLARQGSLRWPSWSGFRPWCWETWAQLRPLRRDLAVILTCGLALVFLYCGCDWKPLPSFMAWARSLPAGPAQEAMLWLSRNLCIFSNAGEGLGRQVAHNMRGHGVYLLGHTGPSYFWYYFPVALTMKLSVPLLLGPLVVGLLRWRALVNWVMVTVAVLLVFSLNCHVQIGVRLVMPLVVLLVIGVAAGLVQAIQAAGPGWRKRSLTVVTAGAVLWTGAASALVWPNWLCYTNELWGGTESGYLCLSDSNYDWGQGVPELEQWCQAQGNIPLDVWYFGSDPLVDRPPLQVVPLHQKKIRGPEDVRALVQGHYLAVGLTLLYGSYGRGDDGRALRNAADYLRTCTPVARTRTFFVYDFTQIDNVTARSEP